MPTKQLSNLAGTGGPSPLGGGTTLLVSPSSLSSSIGDDCSSSRYSSLHDSAATASSSGGSGGGGSGGRGGSDSNSSTTTTTTTTTTTSNTADSLRSAILDSFRMHWIQAWTIMEMRVLHEVTMDDLSSIVNHLEQMISLLVEENTAMSNGSGPGSVPGSVSATNVIINSNTAAATANDLKVCSLGSATQADQTQNATSTTVLLSPLLDFMFSESILDKIYQWSELSGEWRCAMYLEQLKLYELLISHLCPVTEDDELSLFKTPFVRPLIQLLNSLSDTLARASPTSSPLSAATNAHNLHHLDPSSPVINLVEIEKRLILLLNTLCVAFSQNSRLLDLFLVQPNRSSSFSSSTSSSLGNHIEPSHSNNVVQSSPRFCSNIINPEDSLLSYSCDTTIYNQSTVDRKQQQDQQQQQKQPPEQFSFPIFLLLIRFVHRDGPVGQQSRDALLLCLAQSRQDERLAYYIVKQTDFCPVLATGLSGLFSSLPRVLIGQQMSAEQFQFKDDLLHDSHEIEQFLRCLDFCNAVVQISHPIIQIQLLNFIYNGFLVSVIGPALYQDVANVSINDLESLSSYSNTLDEIITTTAYLDLFIRSISEPNLIRIFLEFLCFEVFDNRQILDTLIDRIQARSKLSLITLILFKTLLDLNCEDLLFQLIYKYLIRGKHLAKVSSTSHSTINNNNNNNNNNKCSTDDDNNNEMTLANISNNHNYCQNWLAISGQKLFLNCLSYYLNSLSSSSASSSALGVLNADFGSISSINSTISYSGSSTNNNPLRQQASTSLLMNYPEYSASRYEPPPSPLTSLVSDYPRQTPLPKNSGLNNYFQNYLEYLNDARLNIEQCLIATEQWQNLYDKPLATVTLNGNLEFDPNNDDGIIMFSRMPTVELTNDEEEEEEENYFEEDNGDVDDVDNSHYIDSISFESKRIRNSAKQQHEFSYGFKLNNFHYDDKQRRIFYRANSDNEDNNAELESSSSISSFSIRNQHHHNIIPSTPPISLPLIGHFLSTLLVRLDHFFENDILTNLHLTGLVTRLCHFNHRLLLSLFFDETLPRNKSVPCLLHQLQKLSLTAQNYSDDIANFESMFESAKSNLHSVPIGELNCHILTSNNRQPQQKQNPVSSSIGQKFSAFGFRSSRSSTESSSSSSLSNNVSQSTTTTNNSASKSTSGFGAIKNFFRSSSHKVSHQLAARRNSNASIASTTSHVLEVIPNGGVRFSKTVITTNNNNNNEMDKLTELIYNLIIFDEFLMELSAILTEQSIRLL